MKGRNMGQQGFSDLNIWAKLGVIALAIILLPYVLKILLNILLIVLVISGIFFVVSRMFG